MIVNIEKEVQREMRVLDTIREAKELVRKIREEDSVRLENLLNELEQTVDAKEKRREQPH